MNTNTSTVDHRSASNHWQHEQCQQYEQRYQQDQYQQHQKHQQPRNVAVDQRTTSAKQQEQHQQIHELVQLTAMALQQRCSEQRYLEHSHQTPFHSTRVPQISVWDYVRRIAKYSGCSPECFVLSIIFIDRYVKATACPITFLNIHRLCITAVMVSAKLRDDTYFSNAYYASIGGITNLELNMLELEFLKTIVWFTWVEPHDFVDYCSQLRARYSTDVESAVSPSAQGFPCKERIPEVEGRNDAPSHSVGVYREDHESGE